MRCLRNWRLLATALGLTIGTAGPASVLAHALAHHRDADKTHAHVASLEAHDGPGELSAPGNHAGSHQHVRLDQATRTPSHGLLLGPPVTTTATDPELAPATRIGDAPVTAAPTPHPPGEAPPRLRAPPLY